MVIMHWIIAVLLGFAVASAREVLELEGNTFELALSSHKYLAVLFYDASPKGQELLQTWDNAAAEIGNDAFPEDCEIAKILGNDPDLKELIDAYGIVIPSIKTFRKGILADYRGPSADSAAIAAFLKNDAQPSIAVIDTVERMKEVISSSTAVSAVFGFFRPEDMVDEVSEGYSIEPWGQYLAAGDSLRGHANFYVVTSTEIMRSLKLKNADLPALLMIPSDGDGFIRYSGEILELSVSEWVLRNSAPGLDELTLSTPNGELYATQFFSSRKLKFILFTDPDALDEEVLTAWRSISTLFSGKAIFAYMTQTDVADVIEYFNIDANSDLPMIAAHQPSSDSKYKSKKLDITDKQQLQDFVMGVLTGVVPKVLKSEPLPKKQSGFVQKVVGSNVLEAVSKIETDVLLAITAPGCAQCKRLLPAYELLGRAVQAESRIAILRIDASANDLPSAWGVKDFPTLLWFPARDKPYKDNTVPTPKQYWDAGFSLQELAGFVQRDSSFDAKSLRIATAEQLSSLQGDEDIYRAKFEEEERVQRRNEGRVVYEVPAVDWILGEVVFDGKRWHLAAAGVLVVTWVLMVLYIIASGSAQKPIKKKKAE